LPVETAASICLLLIVFSPFILLAAGMTRASLPQALPDSASSFLVLPYVGASLASTSLVRSGSNGALFLLVLLLLVWAGDVAAYYVGRTIGKTKLAPRISPGKTWEGAVASALGATLVGLLLLHYLQFVYDFLARIHLISPPNQTVLSTMTVSFTPLPLSMAIAFALCVNVAAQFGDLAESMIKRGADLKDSGTLLPGHGGVLDRIDSLLFALPIGWLFYFTLLGRFFRAVAKA
jgi:phosphatidate cytidylyltransferase